MDPLDRPELLTPKEAAQVLGITVTTLAALAKQGQITRHLTVGGHGRYTRGDVERFRDERAKLPTDEERQLIADVVRLYGQGWSIRQVARQFGFSYGKTRRLIRHTKLRARPGERRE